MDCPYVRGRCIGPLTEHGNEQERRQQSGWRAEPGACWPPRADKVEDAWIPPPDADERPPLRWTHQSKRMATRCSTHRLGSALPLHGAGLRTLAYVGLSHPRFDERLERAGVTVLSTCSASTHVPCMPPARCLAGTQHDSQTHGIKAGALASPSGLPWRVESTATVRNLWKPCGISTQVRP